MTTAPCYRQHDALYEVLYEVLFEVLYEVLYEVLEGKHCDPQACDYRIVAAKREIIYYH